MAITHRATSTNQGSVASAGNLNITKPTGTVDDDCMIAIVWMDNGDDEVGQLIGTPAGWTRLTGIAINEPVGRGRTVEVWRKIAATEGASYNFSNDGANTEDMAGFILSFAGVDTTTPEDVTPAGAHKDTTENGATTPPAITTATNGAFVIVFSGVTGTATSGITVSTGYTEPTNGENIAQNNVNIAVGYKEIATAGAETPGAFTFTGIAGTDDGAALTLALRPAGGVVNPSITDVGPLNDEVVYEGELRVEIDGADFEAVQGTGSVVLQDLETTPTDTETQTIRSWSDTQIVFDVVRGSLGTGTQWLKVTNDAGGSTTKAVTLIADPGSTPVARSNPPQQSITLDVAYSLDTAPYFFHGDETDKLTFSISGQPDGVDISKDGTISGTISQGEEASSPFTVTVTATDKDANSVNDVFTWTVSAASEPSVVSDRNERNRGCFLRRLFRR